MYLIDLEMKVYGICSPGLCGMYHWADTVCGRIDLSSCGRISYGVGGRDGARLYLSRSSNCSECIDSRMLFLSASGRCR